MLEIVRIARRTVVRVFPCEVVGELAHVEGLRLTTSLAASRREITVASVPAGGRSRLILEPARVGNPATSNRLDGERRARKRPEALAARASRVDGVGFGKRALRRHVSESAERVISGFDPIEGLLRDLTGAARLPS